MNIKEINNDIKGIVELPLNSKEKTDLDSVLKYLTVEFPQGHASEADILSAIKASPVNCLPRGMLFTMITHGLAKSENEEIHFVVKKGGKKMKMCPFDHYESPCTMCGDPYCKNTPTQAPSPKKVYSPGVTSGEAKVAEAILDNLGAGLVKGVDRNVFLGVLKIKLPKINKRAKAPLALKVMVRGDYLREEENKIFLGKKGKEYLSL